MSESVLLEAERVVAQRMDCYGAPFDNHSATADYWKTYIFREFGVVVPLGPEHVCWMNVLQKISREHNEALRDNKTDVAGFVKNVQMVEEERQRRALEDAIDIPVRRPISA